MMTADRASLTLMVGPTVKDWKVPRPAGLNDNPSIEQQLFEHAVTRDLVEDDDPGARTLK